MAHIDLSSDPNDFVKQGSVRRSSFLGEYLYFLRKTGKWWLLPVLVFFLGFGLLMILASSGAAPFIYALF